MPVLFLEDKSKRALILWKVIVSDTPWPAKVKEASATAQWAQVKVIKKVLEVTCFKVVAIMAGFYRK